MLVRASALSSPALMAVTLTPCGRFTRTGCRCGLVEPVPSWPAALAPQDSTRPVDVSATANEPPARTAVTCAPAGSLTWTGFSRWVLVPSPSWPEVFMPQAQSWPAEDTA